MIYARLIKIVFSLDAATSHCAWSTVENRFPNNSRNRRKRRTPTIRFDARDGKRSRHDTEDEAFETIAGRHHCHANARNISTGHLLVHGIDNRHCHIHFY